MVHSSACLIHVYYIVSRSPDNSLSYSHYFSFFFPLRLSFPFSFLEFSLIVACEGEAGLLLVLAPSKQLYSSSTSREFNLLQSSAPFLFILSFSALVLSFFCNRSLCIFRRIEIQVVVAESCPHLPSPCRGVLSSPPSPCRGVFSCLLHRLQAPFGFQRWFSPYLNADDWLDKGRLDFKQER